MAATPWTTPLLRWDGLHLVFDLALVDRYLRAHLGGWEQLRDVRISGHGDAIRVDAQVVYRGMASRLAVDVAEIRLKHRHLGFRLRRPRALGGMPVPRRVVEMVLGRVGIEQVTVVRGEGIVVVDLRQWLPSELDLSVRTVQASDRSLHLWLGPGAVRDLPGCSPLGLPAGELD